MGVSPVLRHPEELVGHERSPEGRSPEAEEPRVRLLWAALQRQLKRQEAREEVLAEAERLVTHRTVQNNVEQTDVERICTCSLSSSDTSHADM